MIAPPDNVLNGYGTLKSIVGASNALFPSVPNFHDYLKDETYLRGNAHLILRPATHAEVTEIIHTINALREKIPRAAHFFSLTLRGGGSGLSGAAVPEAGIVLDTSRMKKILEIDPKNFIIRAECGITLAEINHALADLPLYYAVDPSSAPLCTLGGSIATNAAGPSSLKYGTTRQNLASLCFVNAEGNTATVGSLPTKTSMGFSLTDLLCGSEGRLGIILDAALRLTFKTEERVLLIAPFPNDASAMDFVFSLRQSGIRPKCVEFIDAYSIAIAAIHENAKAILLIELDGTKEQVDYDLKRLMAISPHLDFHVAHGEKNQTQIWQKRKSITTELKKRFAFKLGEDIAVPLSALSHIASFARNKASERGVETAIWGHAGDGNLHVNYLLQEKSALEILDTLMLELAFEVTRIGGAISGEHGLGRLKRKLAKATLPSVYFQIQDQIKKAFDPNFLFNPALDKEEV